MTEFWFHSGIYQFELPYFAFHVVPNDEGMVRPYYCDVEIHVGNENDLKNGYLATVIIGVNESKGAAGVTNFIDELSTIIRNSYIPYGIKGDYDTVSKKIRWIERNYFPSENFQIVELEWDKYDKKYHSPKRNRIEGDWIINEMRLEPYTK